MRAIAEIAATGQSLRWQQPGALGGPFVLATDSGEETALFRWRVGFGKRGTVETATGRWTLKRTGVWRLTVTIDRDGTTDQSGRLELDRRDIGTLLFAHGPGYRWCSIDLARTQWEWQAADGTALIRFANPQGAFQTVGAVTFAPHAAQLPELDPLVAAGWYLGILRVSGTV